MVKKIKRVLVPLDGSKLAECVLPYVEEITTKLGVDELVLASVTERVKGFRSMEGGTPGTPAPGVYDTQTPAVLVAEAAGKMERPASRYLNRIAKGFEAKGVHVVKEVLFGKPAEEIRIYAKTRDCDLIIMASHGKGGPSGLAHGKVADKVLKTASMPVMVVPSPGCVPDV